MFSLREGVTTVPVVIKGTDRVVRHGLPHFLRITVVFGRPVALPVKTFPRPTARP